MRIRSLTVSLCFCACLMQTSGAYSSYLPEDTSLEKLQIQSRIASVKPSYTRYAAVSFLKSADTTVDFKGTLDVKSQCGALGYVVKVDSCTSKTGKLNGIPVNPYKPSKLCSDDDSIKAADKEEAKKYTTGCCDSRIYTKDEDETCDYNAAKLSNDVCYWGGKNKYRCACDRGRYQYSTIKGEQCGSSFNAFNVNLACSAYEPRTESYEMYFISCCPDSYSECQADNHEVGRGNECRVIDSKDDLKKVIATPALKDQYVYSRYENCVCASHYDKECGSENVINRNFICEDKNHKIWTPESNCESSCSKTIETNIDSYFYKKIWHCLYRKDGAVIRDEEDENSVCGIFDKNKNVGSYDECLAQGYNKREADCYNSSTILRCPNDSTKVWCLEGKYCTGYDVGSYLGVEYCTEGANIEMCPSMDKEKRCQYKNEKCNCMWNDGEFDVTLHNCLKYFSSIPEAQTFATSPTIDGNDETCCKRGYKMQLGRCVKNICDRRLYPYDQRPGEEMGELEVCYEGDNTADLGYKAYFGYTSCHGDAALGQKWIRKSEKEYVCPDGSESCAESEKVLNADYHQCVCARDGQDGRIKLPFGVDLFFNTNIDETDDYTHVGFYQGNYGESENCTDAEGSYYGYKNCYIGSKMLKSGSTPTYKCLDINDGSSDYTSMYQLSGVSLNHINRILDAAGFPRFTKAISRPITNKLGDPSKVFCINPTQHCPNGDPEQCDESVKPLLLEGCVKGWEQECAKCYHSKSLVLEDGKYKLNDQNIKLKISASQNGGEYKIGFTSCPKGYLRHTSSNYVCFKFCSIENKKACDFNDVLTTYKENELFDDEGNALITASNLDKKKVVGVVFARDGSSGVGCDSNGKLHILARNYKSGLNYEEAMAYPTSDEFKKAIGDEIYNLGEWRMPTKSEISSSCSASWNSWEMGGATSLIGSRAISHIWSNKPTVARDCCSTYTVTPDIKTNALPVITLSIN